MAKEALLTMDGVVEEVLRNTQFRVSMANGASVLAYACAR
jgi:translation initiation factor IF-1